MKETFTILHTNKVTTLLKFSNNLPVLSKCSFLAKDSAINAESGDNLVLE
jgi:hypothetical protein